jgi:hypothetical protein
MNPQIEREPPTPPKDHILRFLAKLLKRFRWREVTDMIGKILGLGAGLLFCLAVNCHFKNGLEGRISMKFRILFFVFVIGIVGLSDAYRKIRSQAHDERRATTEG